MIVSQQMSVTGIGQPCFYRFSDECHVSPMVGVRKPFIRYQDIGFLCMICSSHQSQGRYKQVIVLIRMIYLKL